MNNNTSYLAFYAGGYRVLICVDYVLEVLDGSRDAVNAQVRRATWRGGALPLVHMARALGCGPSGGAYEALVLHDRERGDGQPMMIHVDQLDGIVQLSSGDFSELPIRSKLLETYFDGLHLEPESGLSTLRLRPPGSWSRSALSDDSTDGEPHTA